MSGKLTWVPETKTWLHDGQPSTRRKYQKGVDPVRKRRGSVRIASKKAQRAAEKERLRQEWILRGETSARAEYLATIAMLPPKAFLKFATKALKPSNGKCVLSGSHRWDGAFCSKCGRPKRTRGMGKQITKLARLIGMPRSVLSRMVNDDYARVVALVKRKTTERKRNERHAALLAQARELGFLSPGER
jgi:hypothetical protein